MKVPPKKKVIPAMLRAKREENNISQEDFAYLISARTKRDKGLSTSTVSLWESGKRNVPTIYIPAICGILNVDEDDICQFPSQPGKTTMNEVTWKELPNYDGKPLFIHSNNYEFLDSWAIYVANEKKFIFADGVRTLPNSITAWTFYSQNPIYNTIEGTDGYNFNITEVMKEEYIYISMITNDREVKSLYDGWYKHNEDKTAFINPEGRVLPYSGLGVSFIAYRHFRKWRKELS